MCTRIISLSIQVSIIGIDKPEASSIPDSFDVRKVRWGMTKEEVYTSEKWKIAWTSLHGERVYEGSLFGIDCLLVHHFTKEKLNAVYYRFEKGTPLNLRFAKQTLIKKYGKPDETIMSHHLWYPNERTTIVLMHLDIGFALGYRDSKAWKRKLEEREKAEYSDF